MAEQRVQQYGLRIRRLRLVRKMSQAQLGKMTGLDQGFISRVENGIFECTSTQLAAIATALGATVSEILADAVKEPGSSYGAVAGSDPRAAILSDHGAAPGLQQLVNDTTLVEVLKVTPEEWRALRSLQPPAPLSRDGYVQILFALRAATRTNGISDT
ncbi:MAG TPA: helix-turn-helix transcriptional regulator [Methylococcus sp.]|nr:helix-turn-helix transcriptional regulator [Methylococcus sp.]